jgi:hypothetical protein
VHGLIKDVHDINLWGMFDGHAHLSTLSDVSDLQPCLQLAAHDHFCMQLVLLMIMHLGYFGTS